MNILLVEPAATGHHMALYVRLIVRSAIKKGWGVHILTTRTAASHPAYKMIEQESKCSLTLHIMPEVPKKSSTGSLSLFFYQVRMYIAIRRGFRLIANKDAIDFIYVVNFDHCDKALSLFGSPFAEMPFSGMLMSPKHHRAKMHIGPPSRSDILYSWLFLRLLRIKNLHRLTLVDESFCEYAAREKRSEYKKLKFVPDPAELHGDKTKEQCRRDLGISTDEFVVLVYGSLTPRKGIQELLGAMKTSNIENMTILLAGRADERIDELLNASEFKRYIGQKKLLVRKWFHDHEEEYLVFSASDVVWTCYVGPFFGSSGVFYQAGALGLPVIVNRHGLLSWLVKRHDNGLTCDPADPHSINDALLQLKTNSELYKKLGQNGRRLSANHTGYNFGEIVCQSMKPYRL
jgi:glycosyltransferase involved in cell wall biosynthesis